MSFDKVSLNTQLLDSLAFYYMLTIHLSASGWPEEKASKSLREFMKESREGGYFKDSKTTIQYASVAWDKIPGEFLERYQIPPNLHDNIRIIDSAVTYSTKM